MKTKWVKKERISSVLHVIVCGVCGSYAASASERKYLPDWATCHNLNCKENKI